MSESLIIMLHGVGSNGNDLAPLADSWRDLPATLRFASPDAPYAFDQGTGRQWFSVSGVTEANRPQRVAAARAAFDGVVSRLMTENQMAEEPRRVVLAGFSQGAIMALDAVASGRWRFAGVIAFSGRLASPAPLAPAPDVPVLLIHGAQDPVIPAGETQRAAATLQGLGGDCQSLILPGLGHGINTQGVAAAGDFIARVLRDA